MRFRLIACIAVILVCIAGGVYYFAGDSQDGLVSEPADTVEKDGGAQSASAHVVPHEAGSEGERSGSANGDAAAAAGEAASGEEDLPEHAEPDSLPEDDAGEDDEAGKSLPHVYEKNPRYLVKTSPEWGELLHSEIRTGDRAGNILDEWMDANTREKILASAKKAGHNLAKIKLGHPFALALTETGAFRALLYEISGQEILVVKKDGDTISAKIEKIKFDTKLCRVDGIITSSLYNAIKASGEGIELAVELGRIFASEINFITDFREGDTFGILVEKKYRGGDFKGYGRIVGARLVVNKKEHKSYLYSNGRYYNEKGENFHRELLKAPLSFLRVTSRYTMARKHPVHGKIRPHQGIDYGAPRGTPVMAVGSGTVTQAGWAGGYGKQVIIRHANGLESMYGHLGSFAKGISKGTKVKQGQTIGYVGATGVATGPHLDFRIKQGGKFVNPSKLVVPRDRGIKDNKKEMARFRKIVKRVDDYFANRKDLSGYKPDTWFK